jgi:hypothetical protein
MKRFSVLCASALALFLPIQAHAVSAGDVLDRMSADQRGGFMNGALEMLSYQFLKEGQDGRAACIVEWYLTGDGAQEIVAVFGNHKDLPAVAILRTLADRHCK